MSTLDRLQTQVEQLIASNRDLSALLLASERRRGEMMKLVVSFRRLVEATDAVSAIRAVEEILVTVIGTEDFVILAASSDEELKPIGGMGSALEQTPTAEPVARIPLRIHERTVGAIIIASLLSHRAPLGAHDTQVLCLLGDFAATSIIASEERRRWTQLAVPAVT